MIDHQDKAQVGKKGEGQIGGKIWGTNSSRTHCVYQLLSLDLKNVAVDLMKFRTFERLEYEYFFLTVF